jgi:hypothetical protein
LARERVDLKGSEIGLLFREVDADAAPAVSWRGVDVVADQATHH